MAKSLDIIMTLSGAAAVSGALEDITGSASELATQFAGLAGIGVTLASAVEGVKSALAMGEDFEHLSARTGESVKDLVVLSRAFDTAGLGADRIGHAANMLQRALSGISVEGKSTKEAFDQLHLDPQALAAMNFREQIASLSNAFAGIEQPALRTAVAMRLFGREGGQMLQLLGNPELLRDAQEQAGVLAERVADDAKRFEEVSNHLSVIKVRMKELWLAAAEELLPALEQIAKLLHGLDLGPVGAAIGAAGPALVGGAMLAMLANLSPVLVNWALKLGPVLGQNLALGLGVGIEGLGGLLATILPVGLAAAVTYAVVSGIEAAYFQTQKDQEARANQQFSGLHKSSEAIAAATTETALAQQRAEIEAKIAELKKPFMVTGGRQGTHFEKQSADDSTLQAIAGYEKQLALIDRKGAALVAQNASRAAATAAATVELEADKAITEELVKHAKEFAKKAAAEGYALMTSDQKLAYLEQEKQKAKDVYDQDLAAAAKMKDEVASRAAVDKFLASTREIARQVSEIQKKLADDTERQAKAAGEAAKKAQEDATHRNVQGEEDAVGNGLDDIARRRAAIDSSITMTAAEKWAARKTLLQDEIALREKEVETYKKLKAAADASGPTGASASATYDQSQRGAQKGLDSAIGGTGKEGPDPNSFSEQLIAANTRARDSIKTLAEQTGEAWGSTMSGMQGAFAGAFDQMLQHGGTFRSFMSNLYGGLMRSIDEVISQMVAKWIVGEVTKTVASATGATQRTVVANTEVTAAVAGNIVKVVAHTAGENTKTGSSLAGSIYRKAISLGETIYSVAQSAYKTAAHIAGEIASTASTRENAAVRIASSLAESIASVIKAGVAAMSAVASIPYVGPILALAALAAVIGAGMGAVKAIGREIGGPVAAGQPYVVGERRPELFVPGSSGYIFPTVSEGLAHIAAGGGGGRSSGGAASGGGSRGGGSGAVGGGTHGASPVNLHLINAFSPEDVARSQRQYTDARIAQRDAKQSYRR